MSVIKVLTPVHVGTGNKYYVAYVKDGYMYSLDYVLTLMNSDPRNISYVSETLMKSKENISREDFVSRFQINQNLLKKENSIGKTNNYNVSGNVFEQMKENGKLVIPGSTLKGYIVNVLYYDIIASNNEIRKYLNEKYLKIHNRYYNTATFDKYILNNIKKEVTKVFDIYSKEFKFILGLFGVRDSYFDAEINLYEINRSSNKADFYGEGTNLPMGIYETIPSQAECSNELIYNVCDDTKDYINKRRNSVVKTINKIKNDSDNDKKMKILFLDEIIKRIKDLNNWFKEANRKFMDKVLDYQIDFVNKLNNKEVSYIDLNNQLQDLKTLNKTKTIMQIGKSTNYIVKTMSIGFIDTYEKFFKVVFSPASTQKTLKLTPGISMMALIEKNGKGTIPLGFIEVEL